MTPIYATPTQPGWAYRRRQSRADPGTPAVHEHSRHVLSRVAEQRASINEGTRREVGDASGNTSRPRCLDAEMDFVTIEWRPSPPA